MPTNFLLDQLVRLTGQLTDPLYNDQMGRIVPFHTMEVCCNGRYRVELIGGIAPRLLRELSVTSENLEHACECCHKSGHKLLFCKKCLHAKYCDRICQRNDFKKHENECASLGYSRDASKNPLILVIERGNLNRVQELVERLGINVNMTTKTTGSTALHKGAQFGCLPIVRYLLQKGADKDKVNYNGNSPLYIAAREDHLAVVQYLLEKEVDKNKTNNDGFTPLYIAARQDHLAVVQCLLEHGADKDKVDNDGGSPLFIAALSGHLDVVRCLMDKEADKDHSSNNGISPISITAYNGHSNVVQYLLEQGANVNTAASDGRSALHVAAHRSHAEVVTCLMKWGASLTTRDDDGELPIDLAANEEIKQLIFDEEKRRRDSLK